MPNANFASAFKRANESSNPISKSCNHKPKILSQKFYELNLGQCVPSCRWQNEKDQVTSKRMPATTYSRGVGASRLYPVDGGLDLVMGHNQQERQIKLTAISHYQPFRDRKGSSRMKSRLLHLSSRKRQVIRKQRSSPGQIRMQHISQIYLAIDYGNIKTEH